MASRGTELAGRAFGELSVGYAPYDVTLERPGDRRRFPYYATLRGLRWEIADPRRDYDVVVVSGGADISLWSRYRGRAKLVYEQINAYLALPRTNARGAVRGIAKFASRQNRYLLWDYRKGIEQMCRRADAIVCTTQEERERLLRLSRNVHIVLDFHGRDVTRVKTSYGAGKVINLVWEGLPENLRFFDEISEVLEDLSRTQTLLIHAVTDLEYGRYLGWRYGRRSTVTEARRISKDIRLYQWDAEMFSTIVTACDLAVIPVPLQDALNAGKPENKLVLFWRMGLPTVVSATPAYTRAMRACGLDMACTTLSDWRRVLRLYIGDESLRRDAGERGRQFSATHYAEERLAAQWDDVLGSVL